ncbi:MAG TPA: hypothetical protein DCL77_14295 [Prolixibacteraceae bacterium]|jgi:hypothetical protein|nr:hypothetical protein [Prolixibacteraceae bacterium]
MISHQETMAAWDREAAAIIQKYFGDNYPPIEPVIPPEITFPFMMVFHRKKISQRNNNYLVASPIFQLCDIAILKRNLAHKGWPNMTLMFDLPDFMIKNKHPYRYLSWIFQDWNDLERILSPSDKLLIPDLNTQFPCPSTQILTKKGQYKLIF